MSSVSVSSWPYRIFGVSWIAYASFYLCRKNFSIIIPLLVVQGDFSTETLAHIVFAFSAAYAVGQFLFGALTDHFGPRLTVTAGMLISAGAMGLIGASNSVIAMTLIQALNGLAQASGWSGLVKLMGSWFPMRRRGITMAWWSTNYVVGGFFATALATVALTSSWLSSVAWRRVAWAPAIVLGVVAVVFACSVRNSPVDAGLPAVTPVKTEQEEPSSGAHDGTSWRHRLRFITPAFIHLAAAYFFVKLIRYTFTFWLPLYLTQQWRLLSKQQVGYLSSGFELAGVLGVLAAGYLSDKLFRSRKFSVGVLMLIGLGVTSCIGSQLGFIDVSGVAGVWSIALFLAILGMFTYGPDTLLVGAAAQDVSRRGKMGATVGMVDGIGSLGVLISPYLVAHVLPIYGWSVLFDILGVLAFLSAAILLSGATREHHSYLNFKFDESRMTTIDTAS